MRHVTLLEWANTSLRMGVATRGGRDLRWTPSVPIATDAIGPVVEQCWRDLGSPSLRGVLVRISTPTVQVRTLRALPSVSRKYLIQLVKNHRDRFFTRAEEGAVIDATWIDRKAGRARAALAPISTLRLVEDAVSTLGGSVREFRLLDDEGQVISELVLHTEATDALRLGRARRRDFAAVSAALVGFGAPLAVYSLDLTSDARALAAQRDALAVPLSQMEVIEHRLAELRPVIEAVDRQSLGDSWLSTWLGTFAHALPDSAHLVEFSVENNGSGHVVVRARDTMVVLERLQAAGLGQIRISEGPSDELNAEGEWEKATLALDVSQ